MVCRFVGGKYNGQILPVESVWGFASGKTPDYSAARAARYVAPRAELDNMPRVPGYCGPMWDGDAIRYESPEVYDLLSR